MLVLLRTKRRQTPNTPAALARLCEILNVPEPAVLLGGHELVEPAVLQLGGRFQVTVETVFGLHEPFELAAVAEEILFGGPFDRRDRVVRDLLEALLEDFERVGRGAVDVEVLAVVLLVDFLEPLVLLQAPRVLLLVFLELLFFRLWQMGR